MLRVMFLLTLLPLLLLLLLLPLLLLPLLVPLSGPPAALVPASGAARGVVTVGVPEVAAADCRRGPAAAGVAYWGVVAVVAASYQRVAASSSASATAGWCPPGGVQGRTGQ